jgi:hypothetical protein
MKSLSLVAVAILAAAITTTCAAQTDSRGQALEGRWICSGVCGQDGEIERILPGERSRYRLVNAAGSESRGETANEGRELAALDWHHTDRTGVATGKISDNDTKITWDVGSVWKKLDTKP